METCEAKLLAVIRLEGAGEGVYSSYRGRIDCTCGWGFESDGPFVLAALDDVWSKWQGHANQPPADDA